MEGQDGGGQADADPGGPRGHRAGERGRIHREAVVDEVVLGEPDLVEAQLFRPRHLVELARDDVGVPVARRRLQEEVGPEAHQATPRYRVFTSSLVISSAGVPVWTICPRLSTCTRSATESGQRQVLLHQQDRQPAPLELRDHPPHLAHQQRRQAFGRLVHQQQVGIGHERPADRQHLLLAARELVGAIGRPLAQPRKQSIHLLEAPPPGAAAGHLEVLPHAQRREDAPALRHQRHAQLDHAERGQAADLGVLVADAALARRGEAHDGADQRGLAHPVAAQDGQHLARLHPQRDALQHVALAVVGVDALHLKRQGRSPSPAGRPSPARAGRRR